MSGLAFLPAPLAALIGDEPLAVIGMLLGDERLALIGVDTGGYIRVYRSDARIVDGAIMDTIRRAREHEENVENVDG